jgi:hypothetical protein
MGGSALLSYSLLCWLWEPPLPAKGEKNTMHSFRFSPFFRSTLFCLLFRVFCSSLLQVAGLPASSPLLRLADRAVLPCSSCSRMLAGERRVRGRRCCDGKETSLLDLFQVAGGSVSSGGADVETPLVSPNGGRLEWG